MFKIININPYRIYVQIPYQQRDIAKRIDGYMWHPTEKLWSFPNSEKAREILGVIPSDVTSVALEMEEGNGQMPNANSEITRIKETLKDVEWPLAPYDHQYEMTARLLYYKQYGLLAEMGTGKTKAVIDAATILMRNNDINRVFVVAPNSVLYSWQDELVTNNHPEGAMVLTGTRRERIKKLESHLNWFLINYEGVLVLKDKLSEKFNKAEVMVVLDESSKIKNWQAQRTKLLRKIFTANKYKVIMSGTPITQSPLDIYAQYKFLNETFIPHRTFYAFRNRYTILQDRIMGRGIQFKEVVGYKNLDELKRLIHSHGIVLKKKDCLDLPDKIYQRRGVEFSKPLESQYEAMRKHLIIEFDGEVITAPVILTKLLRLQQITSGFYVADKDNPKLKELVEILDETLGNGTKIVIWCRFLRSIDWIQDYLLKKGIEALTIQGKIKPEQRQENIRRFNNGDCNVMIAQIQTGGMGINLQSANIVVYYENDFSLQNRLQSEDRSHRIGMRSSVTYIDLYYRGSIDEQILKAINDKKEIADYLIESYYKGGKQ